ncbi:hypothetical protein O3G_MSEX012545 [Manduca sexta]|uniref:Major facilitator superfamily (MFS) profile domain-containing protein n=1 Tax=Manduca sexta TaxID=7130 RepID=A0A921ZPF1_MANSE|nr:hypothetical protein O3G_MSEX012545 [Manduca sexta]
MNMEVNYKLLPIKGHFFFFNAGTAPLVPYLSTLARQLGFSSGTVGLIYTVLPIFGLIAKPLFGIVADRFKQQKLILILAQIVTIVSFFSIYFLPQNLQEISVELDCNGVTVLKSCYQHANSIDTCRVNSLGDMKEHASCRMNCDMSSPKMWQTVCEHWHIPEYCYSTTDRIQYLTHVTHVSLEADKCAYIKADNVTLDGYDYKPQCRIGGEYVDINEPCTLNCTNPRLYDAIGDYKPNMTCLNRNLNYRLCTNNTDELKELASAQQDSECRVSCELDKKSPWRLMEICEGWHADAANTCYPRTNEGESFPSNLSFVSIIDLSTTISEHECVYIQLKNIEMPDGSIHHPYCESKAQHEVQAKLFYTSCSVNCNNTMVNEMFQAAMDSKTENESQFSQLFWLFFLLMIISWVGQAIIVTFADAICFNLLGVEVSLYGKQRLWGSVGWGIFSLLTGILIDVMSDGAYKNYFIAFIFMLIFLSCDVLVSCFLNVKSTKVSMNILADVGTLVSSLPTFVFMLWTISVGLCTGLQWQFLFWLLEDVSASNCTGSEYIKTLQGLVSAIQTFFGEIPFLFVSGYILKKIGHTHMMNIVLFTFGVRFLLYSCLTNPWWVLPIEMLQGVTFGMFYPTMTSYASIVSPPGTETTVQGVVGAVFEGVGTSLGSLIGGRLYQAYGGWITFRAFGFGALICCAMHILAGYVFKVKLDQDGVSEGKDNIE